MTDGLRILLVEDEAPKRRHISEFLADRVFALSLHTAKSVTTAIGSLEAEVFDLLILDMSLPTFDQSDQDTGGRPQGFGGIEVVRHMSMASIHVPIIVVTGYDVFPKGGGGQLNIEQLRSDLDQEFGSIIIGVLHYSSAVEEWKNELSQLMMKVQ